MLHDHRAFDRALDPDAAQALEDALEPLAALLTEQAKPQPRNVDDFRAWRNQIANLEEQFALVAERGGVTVAALMAAATRELDGQRAASAAPPSASAQRRESAPPPITPKGRDLALEDAALTEQLLEKRRQIVAIDREIAALAKRQTAIHRQIYRRGRRLGH